MNPMTLIRETFVRDPLKTTLPNAGVAKVTAPTTDEEWSVLKWELSTFVCEGEYHSGLRRVLSSYLTCLDRETQPAVWISGFFGCGKSHFARVLEYLWRDLQLPDGASPRGLVDLPEEIAELLIELSTAGRREGGLWSAAGTVSGGEASYVRAALLGIIFKSAGLPTRIPQAEFVLWARQEGIHDPLSGSLAASNRNLYHELRNMYVSTPLSEALLEADTNFASDVKQAKVQLKEQFPNRADVSTEEMVNLIEQVLRMSSTDPKKLPCTMIVLDETQQYIGTDSERALHVQEAVEACCSRFGSHIQFVATGQSAL
ncbi:MAG: BREX system P-loop protein BrxC, partial [Armatimonadetes bacterium CG_4_9_14_3_um_filter_58_7]